MRQKMEQTAKQQEEQARDKEIEQEREQIEQDKLNKQQLTQNGNLCNSSHSNILMPASHYTIADNTDQQDTTDATTVSAGMYHV